MNTRAALCCALTALAACSSAPPTAPPSAATPREYLDAQSGNTVMAAAAPMVFARLRTDVAANARDYATLVAVEVDFSGKYSDYLMLYRWSTVDSRMSAPPGPDQGLLRIIADGRAIDLVPADPVPLDPGRRSELHMPRHGDVIVHGYVVDLPTLRFLAASRTVELRMPQEKLDVPFALWQDGRPALQGFLRRAGPT